MFCLLCFPVRYVALDIFLCRRGKRGVGKNLSICLISTIINWAFLVVDQFLEAKEMRHLYCGPHDKQEHGTVGLRWPGISAAMFLSVALEGSSSSQGLLQVTKLWIFFQHCGGWHGWRLTYAPVVSRNLQLGSSWHSLTRLLPAKHFFLILKAFLLLGWNFFCLSDIKWLMGYIS